MIREMLAVCLLSAGFLSAAEEVPSEARIVMDRVHESFIRIVPYIYSEKKLDELNGKSNIGQKEDIIRTLNDIADFFKTAKYVDQLQRPGFRPGLETINALMSETILAVKNDHTSYAHKRLKSLSGICIACHTQIEAQKTFGQQMPEAARSQFTRAYDYANYLMLLRRYHEAEKYYEKSLQENLKDPLGEHTNEEISQALKRVLSIHTQVEFDFHRAQKFVRAWRNNKKMPKTAHDNLAQWEKSLQQWRRFDPLKVKSIQQFIHKHLTPIEDEKADTAFGKNDITLLVASGVLNKFIAENTKSDLMPQVLFWLAVAEKRLGSSYMFSMGEIYLKECIQLYPKSAFARKCFKEYEDNITFGYSGSSGTHVPDDEKQEMARLKALLK